MRKISTVSAALFIGLAGAELIARYAFGLGTPPLTLAHPTIDYMFAPDQDVYSFGNRQLFNEQGMRSEPLSEVGQRDLVLVFGDSVLNGGNLTSHEELATTLATNDDVFFGNVSAGSWGPGNYHAWINEFGLHGATHVLFVLSDHDLNDQPEFEPLNPSTHPTEKPLFALSEIFTRYLPDEFGPFFEVAPKLREGIDTRDQQSGIEDMQDMFASLAEKGTRSCLMFHPTQSELGGKTRTGTEVFQEVANSWKIPTIDLAGPYLEVVEPSKLYRENDDIHINAEGQKVLAQELWKCHELAQVPTVPKAR